MAPSRTESPAPRGDKAQQRHTAPGGEKGSSQAAVGSGHAAKAVTASRKQTRPIGEFGGNLGCLFWTLTIPTCLWYLYGCVVLEHGALAWPGKTFWYDLVFGLPAGVAIRPTLKGFGTFVFWIVTQALLEILVPAKVLEGVVLKSGKRLKYPMNGLASFFLTHVVLYGLCWFGVVEPYFVWRNMGDLLTSGVIVSFLLATWMYVDFGIFWERHVNDPEFEEDWGVFNRMDCINDWWLGVARHPRILHRWLKVPFDVKRFSNARPGLTAWVICNQSYLAAMYFGCRMEGNAPVCNATGDWGRVGWPALMIAAAHWYYIFDYNWNEPAYLTTTDIRHDLYGFMLSYGCLGFLPWYYSFAFCGHLAAQVKPVNDNSVQLAVGLGLYLLGMWLFRVTNIQKHNFRTYISEGGDLSKYKVWGKPVEYVKTEEGSYLLTSGYWALARHFNYIGDMIMCIGWAVACAGPSHGFPWAPVSYCVYFWMMDIHRLVRDEARCAAKYKKDWERYKELVPSFIFPRVF